MASDMTNMNFTSVKVGDVNYSATVNLDENASESRTSFVLNADEKVVNEGEISTIDLTASEILDIHGFQFTLETGKAELVNIWVDNKVIDASHIAQLSLSLIHI